MANLIKSVKVNGTQYGIDYESLENLPFYKNVTDGDYILEETSVEIADYGLLDIQETFDPGQKFIVTFDGVEYEAHSWIYEHTHYSIVFMINQFSSATIDWNYDPDSDSYGTGTISIDSDDMIGTHTISIRKCVEELEKIDRVYLGEYYIDVDGVAYIDAGLECFDFLGSTFCETSSGSSHPYHYLCTGAQVSNIYGFVNFYISDAWNMVYNPSSGACVHISYDPSNNVYDVSEIQSTSTTYSAEIFNGAALVYGDGDPVIAWNVYRNSSNSNIWELYTAERYLKNSSGEVVHDMLVSPILFNVSTGVFSLTAEASSKA